MNILIISWKRIDVVIQKKKKNNKYDSFLKILDKIKTRNYSLEITRYQLVIPLCGVSYMNSSFPYK